MNAYVLSLLLVGFGYSTAIPWDVVTPLEDYYWREMNNDIYKYEVHDEFYVPGTSVYILRMTSLAWRNGGLTQGRKFWKHWVTIVVPDELRVFDKAMIRFEGGQLKDDPPKRINFKPTTERLFKFSYDTGAVCAEISNIPSQNLKFKGDDWRWEDDLLAKSFSLYTAGAYNNTDHFIFSPMLRAARRGIDTVIEFTRQRHPSVQIQSIMASGRSKRGWLTWLLGGIDRRVFAIHPEAFSQANYVEFLQQQFQSLGGWSWASIPYYQEGTPPNTLYNPRGAYLFEEYPLDPMQYFERMADTPIMLVLSPGDEFFLPDASYHFWQHITSLKYLRLVENTSHRFRGRYDDIWDNMATFFMMLTQDSVPSMTWERQTDPDDNQEMTVTLDRAPKSIRTWCAETGDGTVNTNLDGSTTYRRDFRELYLTPQFQFIRTHIIWTDDGQIEDLGNNIYSTSVTAPANGGFKACFVEATFDGFDTSDPFLNEITLNSEVIIAPNILPYDRCTSFGDCVGVLR